MQERNMTNWSEKYTYPLFETIRIENGEIKLLEFHQRRVNHTFKYFFPGAKPLCLCNIISTDNLNSPHRIKCRVSYNEKRFQIEYSPYSLRQINELVPVETNLSYPFKFEDRTQLLSAKGQLQAGEEILYVTNARIRECSYANVLLEIDGDWLTPMYPIFHGVMRSYLLQKGIIRIADLFLSDLEDSQSIKLVNAMMPIHSCIHISTR